MCMNASTNNKIHLSFIIVLYSNGVFVCLCVSLLHNCDFISFEEKKTNKCKVHRNDSSSHHFFSLSFSSLPSSFTSFSSCIRENRNAFVLWQSYGWRNTKSTLISSHIDKIFSWVWSILCMEIEYTDNIVADNWVNILRLLARLARLASSSFERKLLIVSYGRGCLINCGIAEWIIITFQQVDQFIRVGKRLSFTWMPVADYHIEASQFLLAKHLHRLHLHMKWINFCTSRHNNTHTMRTEIRPLLLLLLHTFVRRRLPTHKRHSKLNPA